MLVALGRWGARAPLDPECMGMSVDSHVVSLATLFDPGAAGRFEASLSCGWARTSSAPSIAGRAIDAGHARRVTRRVLTLDPGTLLALIHDEISVADALASARWPSRATARRSSASWACSPCPSPRAARGEPA